MGHWQKGLSPKSYQYGRKSAGGASASSTDSRKRLVMADCVPAKVHSTTSLT